MGPLSIGLAGFGLASQIYGGIKSAQANKEAEANINQQEKEEEAFYNNRVNRDFMETNAAKGVVEQLRKRYDEQAKTIDSNAAATGGTAESTIAAKTKLNDKYNDVMSNVAEKATNVQERADYIHENNVSDLAKQRMELTKNKGEQATNLMGTGANLLGTAADVGALDGDKAASNVPVGSQVGVTPENRTKLNNTVNTPDIPSSKVLDGDTLDLDAMKTPLKEIKPSKRPVQNIADGFSDPNFWKSV